MPPPAAGERTLRRNEPQFGTPNRISCDRTARQFAYRSIWPPPANNPSWCCNPDIADPPKAWDIEKTDDGLNITSGGPGSGQITINSTDVESAILGVTVYLKPASVVVSPSSASLEVDGTTTLTATIEDANGNSIHVNQDDGRGGHVVYWETSDDTVATVEGSDATEGHNTGATATVTAVAAGSATITGRWGSVSGTATVTVMDSN